MPWKCALCGQEPKNQPLPPPKGKAPACDAKKCIGTCTWQVVVKNTAEVGQTEAAALGYGSRVNTFQASFPNGHKTNVVFANSLVTRAISPDGSNHSGNRIGWKGFEKKNGGWSYCGSFDPDLNAWTHRPNNRAGAFPGGNENRTFGS
jgi:hypothetical protein